MDWEVEGEEEAMGEIEKATVFAEEERGMLELEVNVMDLGKRMEGGGGGVSEGWWRLGREWWCWMEWRELVAIGVSERRMKKELMKRNGESKKMKWVGLLGEGGEGDKEYVKRGVEELNQ